MTEHLPVQSPPSVYAIWAFVDGEPNSLGRVAKLTLQRIIFIAPGLYVSGLRGRKLLKASLATSVSITASLGLYYWLRHKKGVRLPSIE